VIFQIAARRSQANGPIGSLFDIDYVVQTATGYSASRHKLDIFYPSSGSGPWPVVVFVHAGGFTGGDHRTCRTPGHWMRRTFETNNCVLVSPGYRLAPSISAPGQRHDIGAAIRFLRFHAHTLHLDPNRIVFLPYSAGANIAMMTCVTADNPAFAHAPFGLSGVSEATLGCFAFAGPYRFSTEEAQQVARFGSVVRVVADASSPEGQLIGGLNPYDVPSGGVAAAAAASPYTHVAAGSLTFRLEAGTNDQTVVCDQSSEMASALAAVGHTATSTLHSGEGHNITANVTITNAMVDAACTFVSA
jgi:acetyl esterase/lipase